LYLRHADTASTVQGDLKSATHQISLQCSPAILSSLNGIHNLPAITQVAGYESGWGMLLSQALSLSAATPAMKHAKGYCF
jgi:hypothetical protein